MNTKRTSEIGKQTNNDFQVNIKNRLRTRILKKELASKSKQFTYLSAQRVYA